MIKVTFALQVVTIETVHMQQKCTNTHATHHNYDFNSIMNYRISGKFGGDLKLAVWRLQEKSPILMLILINNY